MSTTSVEMHPNDDVWMPTFEQVAKAMARRLKEGHGADVDFAAERERQIKEGRRMAAADGGLIKQRDERDTQIIAGRKMRATAQAEAKGQSRHPWRKKKNGKNGGENPQGSARKSNPGPG